MLLILQKFFFWVKPLQQGQFEDPGNCASRAAPSDDGIDLLDGPTVPPDGPQLDEKSEDIHAQREQREDEMNPPAADLPQGHGGLRLPPGTGNHPAVDLGAEQGGDDDQQD